LWLLAILFELKDVTIVGTWVMRFPGAEQFGDEAIKANEDENGDTTYLIQGITSQHRYMVGLMNACRFVLTTVLLGVGVSFLLKSTDYVGLLMDAVALVFIVEIANILYTQVLRGEVREQCESLEPMTVPMYGIEALNTRPAVVDLICLVSIFVVTLVIMHLWNDGAVEPIYDALSCACLSEGEKCHEANRFSYDFWYNYWKLDVPLVFKQVDELKSKVGAAASVLLANGRSRGPHTLLKMAAHRFHSQL